MKKSVVMVIAVVVVLILSLSYVFISEVSKVSFAPIFEPPIDCTSPSIQILWDTIFEITSTGITIITDPLDTGICDNYYAYKMDPSYTYILAGSHLLSAPQNITEIIALKGDFTDDTDAIIASITEENLTSGAHISSIESIALDPETNAVPEIVASEAEADIEFDSTFFIENASIFELDAVSQFYDFSISLTNESTVSVIDSGVHSQNSTTYYKILETTGTLDCAPSWNPQDTTCQSDETYITYYTDSNNCGDETGLPENTTNDCDYDGNGIIGNESNIVDDHLDVELFIDGDELNLSETYDELEIVEIKEGSTVRVSFSFDFSPPLNLREIEIEKQSSSSEVGYLIVNGIDEEKRLRVDKLNVNSNSVCIKDREINSIASISDDCGDNDEELLSCPGSIDDYGCTISGSLFVVTGLENSAVLEFISNNSSSPPSCSTSWNCTSWNPAVCPIDETQTRVCTDSNNCNTTFGKPSETQACSSSCSSEWDCSLWSPSECPESETRVRTCDDLNNCGTFAGKPSEEQSCDFEEPASNTKKIILIIVVVIVVLVIIFSLIMLIRKTNAPSENLPSRTPYRPTSRGSPPAFQSPQRAPPQQTRPQQTPPRQPPPARRPLKAPPTKFSKKYPPR